MLLMIVSEPYHLPMCDCKFTTIYGRGYLPQNIFNRMDGSVTAYLDSVTENQRVERAKAESFTDEILVQ
jgi:hypothetical protein